MKSLSMVKNLCTVGVLAMLTSSCVVQQSSSPTYIYSDAPEHAPENVILFIGDGMGQAQAEAGAYVKFGQQTKGEGKLQRLSFQAFPVLGTLNTCAADSFVTDSAASGTSLACGIKTNNGVIGQDPDHHDVDNVAQFAKEKGLSVGVLSSVSINHATPASFYANVKNRGQYKEIFSQFLDADFVDVGYGAGLHGDDWPLDKAIAAAEGKGMLVRTPANLHEKNVRAADGQRVLGLFDLNNDRHLAYTSDRTANPNDPASKEPTLAEITLSAVKELEPRDGGFFMMVEGGAIDWACHGNDIKNAVGEVLELDKAVEATISYLRLKGELENTLIIVTADHETGGLTFKGPYEKVVAPGDLDAIEVNWSTGNHSAIPVPVYARGPMAGKLSGKHDQTFVYDVIKHAITDYASE